MKRYIFQIIIVSLVSLVLIQLTCNKTPDNGKQLLEDNKKIKAQLDYIQEHVIDSLSKVIDQKEFNQTILKTYYVNEEGKISAVPDDSLAKFFEWYVNSRRAPGLSTIH